MQDRRYLASKERQKRKLPKARKRKQRRKRQRKERLKMASEKQANKAREEYSTFLQSLGVHAIGVDQIKKKGEKEFAVIAYLEKKNPKLPGTLIVNDGNKRVEVPVVAKIAEK